MLFLERKIDQKINVGTDSWVRFCGIYEGDAVFIICDGGRMRTWVMMLNGKPYYFENNTEMKYVGWSRGQASIGFAAPNGVTILREEIENFKEKD